MSLAEKIMLRPVGHPRKLDRLEGFTTASVAVGINGDSIRLLVLAKDAEALVARTNNPDGHLFRRRTPIMSTLPSFRSRVIHENEKCDFRG